jgi:ADP-heptose:LPS heptosyltransferase
MAGILRRAGLLIGNNSGAMHIADAVGTPMVILYSGAELREQWRPRSAPAVLLTRPAACSPCHRMQCPYSMECLDIPPEKVVEKALAILGKQVLDRHRAGNGSRPRWPANRLNRPRLRESRTVTY